MKAWTANGLGQLKALWSGLSPVQRWLGIGLGLALLAAVWVASYLNRPDWVVLVNQGDPKDVAAIVARLDELKVPYRPVGDGFTITVPRSEQFTARLALAQSGVVAGGTVGMELFDEPKFGATDFDRKVNLLRAQQGELERALLRIAEVEYANVKLAIPEQTVFIRDQQPVTASVLLQIRPGKRLTPDQVAGVVSFVSGSVQGLTPENVRVVDQSGRLLSTGLDEMGAGMDQGYLDRQEVMQRDMEHRVQTLLESIFGPGNVVTRVNLELNLDRSRIEANIVGEGAPRLSETVRESAQGTSQGFGDGPLDPEAVAPIYQDQQGAASNNDFWRSQTTTSYETSQTREVTLVQPGAVKRVSVGVVVNRTELSDLQRQQIQNTVAQATGAPLESVSVAAMPFGSGEVPGPTVPEPVVANEMNLLPLGASVAVGLLLLVVGYLLARRRRSEAQRIAAEVPLVGARIDEVLGGELNATDLVGNTSADQAEAETQAQQESSSGISEQFRRKAADVQPVDEDLKRTARELLSDSPEASAEVLRQWLKEGA